ncbi:MAG: Glu-tRNA(Gln) amidotransferase subunit GatD [archaeon]|nr:Glu-tRNA(Gln) amidotransferase subunit GatD [archaeon]MDA1167549.1 Glu-tRNA(Gln) amidotransferase subunit GatD [archaeon]
MDELPEVGERIRIRVQSLENEVEHVGIVLPFIHHGFITLKLENGYNANYTTDGIVSWESLDSAETHELSSSPVNTEFASNLPKVRLIHTGGTIASKVDYKTGAVIARFEPEELVAQLPELIDIAQLETFKIGNMFSDDIRPQHWNQIAEATKQAFDDGCRGVVVSHGTDTLHLTAAAVGFAWAGKGGRAPGPIAFVGSQRSSDRGSSDAAENLLSAVYWAAHGERPCGDVGDSTVVIMHHTSNDGECIVLPGMSTRKLHSSRRDAFQAVNAQPLATISYNGTYCTHATTDTYAEAIAMGGREVTNQVSGFLPHLKILQFIAGPYLHGEHIEATVKDGCDAIIIHGTGLGHLPIEDSMGNAPENQALWRTLVRCVNREIPVVVCNQCIFGPVNMNVYSKGREQQNIGLLGHGVAGAPDTVAIKAHWLLSNELSLNENIAKPLCGEQSEVLFE